MVAAPRAAPQLFQFPMPAPQMAAWGVTQGHTPSGMTQIQPLAEPLPQGPTISRAGGGGEVTGSITGSRGRSDNSLQPVTSPSHAQLTTTCTPSVQGCEAWTLSGALTGSKRRPRKLLTLQMRGTDNSRPRQLLSPQQALSPPWKQLSRWPSCC